MSATEHERQHIARLARQADHDARVLGGFAIIQAEELLRHLVEYGVTHHGADEHELGIYLTAVKDLCHAMQTYNHAPTDGHLTGAGHPAGLHPSIVDEAHDVTKGTAA